MSSLFCIYLNLFSFIFKIIVNNRDIEFKASVALLMAFCGFRL